MAYSVTLPELGESVTEGTVTRWLKQVGESVEVDEPLLEISTDKVDTEVPSPVAGTVQQIVAGADSTVEVGAELALIDDGSGGAGSQTEPQQEAQPQAQPEPSSPQPAPSQPAPQPAASDGGGSSQGSPVTLPELGESVTEGTVTRWLKQVGDTVEVDEPLLEISTDKVDTEVPSPVAGTVLEITAAADSTVEVGAQLAVVGSGSPAAAAPSAPQQPPQQDQPAAPESAPQQSAPSQQPAQPAAQPQSAPQSAPPSPGPAASESATDGEDTPYVTPLVRKLASENNIDLNSLTGSGVGGRIRKQDVLAAIDQKQQQQAAAPPQSSTAPAPAQAPAASGSGSSANTASDLSGLRGTTQKASRIRQITAEKTKESLQNSAQLTQVHEVDVTRIAKLRQRAKQAFREREGVSLTFLPFFAKATVEAL